MDLISDRVLVTGGAGFIGSRLIPRLLERGASRIIVVDDLHPQVHGPDAQVPDVLHDRRVYFRQHSVCDAALMKEAAREADPGLVLHLAAETGTGQSADEIRRYCDVNVSGTATLLESIRGCAGIRRVVLASSRAVYGEGQWLDENGKAFYPWPRAAADLKSGKFQPRKAWRWGEESVAAGARTLPHPTSIYGVTKLMQEYLLRVAARTGDWRPVILRFQNVYGEGQSLRNPYTGVLSIFARQILEGKKLSVYEDGQILRDFVHVDDVVAAVVRCCDGDVRFSRESRPIDIGSGRSVSIEEIASRLLRLLGRPATDYWISGEFRAGDIRHARCDSSLARSLLGWSPTVDLERGLRSFSRWAIQEFSSVERSPAPNLRSQSDSKSS